MSERYNKLYICGEIPGEKGAPAMITAGALVRDLLKNQTIALLKIRNLSEKKLEHITAEIVPTDPYGKDVYGPIAVVYGENDITDDGEYGSKKRIMFPDCGASEFRARITEVVFDDGTSWYCGCAEDKTEPEEKGTELISEIPSDRQADESRTEEYDRIAGDNFTAVEMDESDDDEEYRKSRLPRIIICALAILVALAAVFLALLISGKVSVVTEGKSGSENVSETGEETADGSDDVSEENENAYDAYDEVIADYEYACNVEADYWDENCDTEFKNLNCTALQYYHHGSQQAFYYAYYDVNHDGIDELFIATGAGTGNDKTYGIIDSYCYSRGAAVKITDGEGSLGDRSDLAICTDGTMILCGSTGADSSMVEVIGLSEKDNSPVVLEKNEYSADDEADTGAVQENGESQGTVDIQKLTWVFIAGPEEEHRYEVYIGDVSWTKAEEIAESKGGHLVTITSEEEYEKICKLCDGIVKANGTSSIYVWIGANRDDSQDRSDYTWITGEEWSFDNWYPGEPSYIDEGEEGNETARETCVCLWNAKYDGEDVGWTFNDQRDNLAEEYSFTSGRIAYIVEYGD